jgi:hypothetical protein
MSTASPCAQQVAARPLINGKWFKLETLHLELSTTKLSDNHSQRTIGMTPG